MAQGLIGYGFDDEKAQYFFDAKAEGAEVAPLIPALLEYIKSVPSFVKKIFKTKTDESLSKGRGFVKGLLLFAARFHKHLLDMTDEVTAGREGRAEWSGARCLEKHLARLKKAQPSKFLVMAGMDAEAVTESIILLDGKSTDLIEQVETLHASHEEILAETSLLKKQASEFNVKFNELEEDKIGRVEALDKIEDVRKRLVNNLSSYARVASLGSKQMRRDMKDLKTKVEPFMLEMSTFKSDAERRLAALEKMQQEQTSELDKVKRDLRRHSEEARKRAAAEAATDAALAGVAGDIADLKDKDEAHDAQITAQAGEITALGEETRELKSSQREQKKATEAETERAINAEEALAAKLAAVESTTKEVAPLKDVIDAAVAKLEVNELKGKEMAEQLIDLKSAIKQLRRLLEESSGRTTTLRHEQRKALAEVEEQLKGELARATAAEEALEKKIGEAEAATDAALAGVAGDIADLKDKDEALQDKLDAESERATKAEFALKSQHDELSMRLEVEKSEKAQLLDELKVKGDALRTDLEKMKHSYESELAKAKLKAEDHEREIADVKAELKRTRAEQAEARVDLDKTEDKLKKARKADEEASGKGTAIEHKLERNQKKMESMYETLCMKVAAGEEMMAEHEVKLEKLDHVKRQHASHIVHVVKTQKQDAATLEQAIEANAAELNVTKAKVSEIDEKLESHKEMCLALMSSDIDTLGIEVIDLKQAIATAKKEGIDLITAIADANSEYNEKIGSLNERLTTMVTDVDYVARGVELGDERAVAMGGDFKLELESLRSIIDDIKVEQAVTAEKARADETEEEEKNFKQLKERDDLVQADYEERVREEDALDVDSLATTEEDDEEGSADETGSPSPMRPTTVQEPEEEEEAKAEAEVNLLSNLEVLVEQAYAMLSKF